MNSFHGNSPFLAVAADVDVIIFSLFVLQTKPSQPMSEDVCHVIIDHSRV